MGKSTAHDNTADWLMFCDVIPNLLNVNFVNPTGQNFGIDNENDTPVILSVKFAGSNAFVSKKFLPGTNPFLLKEIAKNTILTALELSNLKYGF